MKLMRFAHAGAIHAGVVTADGVIPVPEINARRGGKAPDDLLEIIRQGARAQLEDVSGCAALPFSEVKPLLPYDIPPKIWCIGLNYKSHAIDINAVQPEEPGSFMKPASSMFPPSTSAR